VTRQPIEVIKDLYKRGSRKPKKDDSDYSLYDFEQFVFPIGMQTASRVSMNVRADLQTAREKGLFKGRVSLQNRKLDAPLWIEKVNINFYHKYDSQDEFLDYLMNGKVDIYMKFVNDIVFKVVFGNPYRSHEMRCVFENIFAGVYKPKGSSLQFDRTGKEIILNLSLEIPKKVNELDEGIIVGVNLRSPEFVSVCSLNNGGVVATFGNRADLRRVKAQMKAQRTQLQKSLKYTSSGHGRKKKLVHMDNLSHHEANFVKTYQHKISKDIVDFAVKNNAKYINIEDLADFNEKNTLLSNFPYFNLITQITYKANIQGITVRQVKCCAEEETGNEDIYKTAKQIALSVDWVKESKKKDKEAAEETA
jgi:IS605 OrfB family transposase